MGFHKAFSHFLFVRFLICSKISNRKCSRKKILPWNHLRALLVRQWLDGNEDWSPKKKNPPKCISIERLRALIYLDAICCIHIPARERLSYYLHILSGDIRPFVDCLCITRSILNFKMNVCYATEMVLSSIFSWLSLFEYLKLKPFAWVVQF